MQCVLVLLNGPTAGAVVELSPAKGPTTIGRDAARELPVDDQLCSRLHARVWFDGSRWQIEDCGSRNGTFLNSQPIQRSVLEPGDLIRVGERLIVFVEETGQPAWLGLRPSKLGVSTFVVRVPDPDKREAIVEQLRAESPSRPVRDAAILCQLASRLHEQSGIAALVRLMIATVAEATQADRVAVYLVARDGRLRCAGRSDSPHAEGSDAHVLASLSVQNGEALLVEQPASSPSVAPGTETAGTASGTAIAVPIPGRTARRGAVECHRQGDCGTFAREDLDLVIAIANQVGLALENLEHRERLELANEQLRDAVATQSQIIGTSPPMRDLLGQVAQVAPTTATVLIFGDSGTGKELVARAIHELSSRRAGPFLAVNCAAFSESLLESELFGHERGAFTGADRRRLGQFERAHGGTLFLDEIGELSPACQAKLLRVLEGHPFERVGGNEPVQVDVRIVAATHRDLAALLPQGRFREDLFYRLRVIELRVPPLRERGDDVLLLAAHFLDSFRRQIGRGPVRLSEHAARTIQTYSWPGNVRELKNAIERAVVLGQGEEVTTADLAIPAPPPAGAGPAGLVSLAEAERRHIDYVLRQVEGNKTRACEILAIGRGTLYKKLASR